MTSSLFYCLTKPYPQQIADKGDLYKLTNTVARDLVRRHGASYPRLAFLGWTEEDLAEEIYWKVEATINLPIDTYAAWNILQCDMKDALRVRKKEQYVDSLSAPMDPTDSHSEELGDTIPADVTHTGSQHTLSPYELLEASQTPPIIDPDDLPTLVNSLPSLQRMIIHLRYLSTPAASLREVAEKAGVSKSTVARMESEAIVTLVQIVKRKCGTVD